MEVGKYFLNLSLRQLMLRRVVGIFRGSSLYYDNAKGQFLQSGRWEMNVRPLMIETIEEIWMLVLMLMLMKRKEMGIVAMYNATLCYWCYIFSRIYADSTVRVIFVGKGETDWLFLRYIKVPYKSNGYGGAFLYVTFVPCPFPSTCTCRQTVLSTVHTVLYDTRCTKMYVGIL